MRRHLPVSLLSVALLAVAGCGSGEQSGSSGSEEPTPSTSAEPSPEPSGPTELETALAACEDSVGDFLEQTETDGDPGAASSVSSDGAVVEVGVSAPEADPDLGYYLLSCLLDETGAPETASDDLLATEDGQEEQLDWEGYEATWTVDPDSGYAGEVRSLP